MKPVPEQFAQDVQSAVFEAGRDVTVMACQHNEERANLEKESYFPFRFDESAAHAALSALDHLRPSPAESFFVWRAFGWRYKATGARRYSNEAF
ncbi:MAG TPA: hypothetical protein VGH51_02125 [Candidatus Angelobacter sp.]|jgi:hypothetical protein